MQGFAILYAAWFNQRWYWQQVRPHLLDTWMRWTILVHILVATFLVALLLALIACAGGVLSGVTIVWGNLLPGVFIGLGLTSISLWWGVRYGIPWIASAGLCLSTACGLLFTLPLGVLDQPTTLRDLIPATVIYAIIGALLGISVTLPIVLIRGEISAHVRHSSMFSSMVGTIILLAGFIFFSSFPYDPDLLRFLVLPISIPVLWLTSGMSVYICHWWAIRQVNDADRRRYLARPEG